MYTELYLATELKKDTPEGILKWLDYQANTGFSEGWWEIAESLAPEGLKGRLSTIGNSSSYYFSGIPFIKFEIDDLHPDEPMYFLTTRFDIKNYQEEIENFLKVLEPWIETEGWIGNYRYEDDEVPSGIFNKDGKIVIENQGELRNKYQEIGSKYPEFLL